MRKFLLTALIFLIPFTFLYSQAINNIVLRESRCGLKYIQKSAKVTTRYATPLGQDMPITLNVSELPASCYRIVRAYVWFTVSYSSSTPTSPTVNVVNPQNNSSNYAATQTGQGPHKCWNEQGTRGYRANVTASITGNGDYLINTGTANRETDGLTLFIAYEDLTENFEGHLVINDGLRSTSSGGSMNENLTGFTACGNSTFAEGFLIVSDMQNSVSPTFNGIINGTTHQISRNFWNSESRQTNVTQGQSSASFGLEGGGDCYAWLMMGLYFRTTTCRTCPQTLDNIKITPSKTSICAGEQITLTASGGVNYQWSSNPPGLSATTASIQVSPNSTTTYFLRGADASNCQFGYDTVTITVYPNPSVNLPQNVETCLGSPILIGNTATGGRPPYSYNWTPTTGLSASNTAQVTANPNQTTNYTVTVTDGNGCQTSATIRVIINPLPNVNPGPNVATCSGTAVQIGNPATGGTPPYSYSWSPAQGLSATNVAQPMANPNQTTTYTVVVTDAKSCRDTASITVRVNPLPNPVITPLGPTRFCSCDSVILDAGNNGYVSYQWNTGATTRTIVVRDPGSYTVIVVDTNGCRNTSPPILITVIQPTTVVTLSDTVIRKEPGEIFNVILRITDQTDLDFCKAFNFKARIRFNKTIMVPFGNTPQGIIDNQDRVITLQGRRNGFDPNLANMTFLATLGEVEESNFLLEFFEWDDCRFDVTRIDTTVRLINLCKAGGITRLFKSGGGVITMTIKPNPSSSSAEIEFTTPESGFTHLAVYDLTGIKISDIYNGVIESGSYRAIYDVTNIATGVYFVILKTPSEVINRIMEVQK
ncbi:MAG: hypothetical protein N2319_11425 [Candidatus Kapabacteria bacterium]|nr:hypothetical protein [Candidatus Kapabacteria bacterium]